MPVWTRATNAAQRRWPASTSWRDAHPSRTASLCGRDRLFDHYSPNLVRRVVSLGGEAVSGRTDIVDLYAARAARGFGDGFAAIILPAYLLEIGFGPFQIGLVATAALLGSAATTLAVGFLAPRYDLRTLLLACAALMVV